MTRPLMASTATPEHVHAEGSGVTQASTLELLSWLLRYPLLRACDLATLMDLSLSVTAARLAHARAEGLVRSLPAALLGRHVVRLHALTPLGLASLAQRDSSVAWERARRCQADTTGLLHLLSDLPAVLTTQSFVLALIAHAEEALCRQPTQRSMWSWSRHVRLRSFSTESDQHTGRPSLRCDASVRLVVRSTIQGVALPSWLMVKWDSGLSRPADVRRELQVFLRIRDTYERQGLLTAFPTLMVLAPDARRATLWQTQALRLATERWLTHPLRGGALPLNDNVPLLSVPHAVVGSINPWQVAWRSFAQPRTQTLSDILQADGNVSAGASAQWQMPRRTTNMRDGVEVARLILRLDARSLRVLTALYLHPLLSMRQLAAVLDIQSASVGRMLRRLRRLDLAQTQTWSGVQHGALSERGVLLLAHCAHLPGGTLTSQVNGHSPRILWRYQREVRALARTPEHTTGVYNFFTRLLESCTTGCAQGHDAVLLWWETGARCARAFHDAGGWQVIRPDGAGEWRIEGQSIRFWLEWDRGTMGPRDLRAKFAAYARYVRSHEWRADGNTPLPALLIVTAAEEQVASIEQALGATLPAHLALNVYITTSTALLAQGPLAPIWRLCHAAEPVRAATSQRLANLGTRVYAMDIHAV